MTTKFYLEGKKITRKTAKEIVGEDKIKAMIKESKQAFMNDPLEQSSYWIGKGMLTIEFA